MSATGSAREIRTFFLLAAIVTLSASTPLAVGAAIAGATFATSMTLVPLILVTVILVMNICHEFGHLAAFCLASRGRPHVHLVARFGFAHIVRPQLPAGRDIIVIVAGPCCVAFTCVGLAFIAPQPLLVVVLTAIGAGHLASLALPFGDGANLREALRASRTRRSL